MLPSFTEILKSYRFNAFIQSWIVMQIHIVATRLGQERLVAACQRTLETIDAAVRLRNTYKLQQGKHLGSDEARQLGVVINRAVSHAHSLLESTIKSQNRMADAAAKLMEAAFPQGLGAHVHADFQTQATFHKMFLAALRDPAHTKVVAYLHLDDDAAELAELLPQFNVAVGLREPVTGAMVQAAESAGQDALMKLVCDIVVSYDESKPEEKLLMAQLLAPYLEANNHVRAEYAKRAASKAKVEEKKEEEKKDEETCEDKPAEDGAAPTGGTTTTPAGEPPVRESPVTGSPVSEPPVTGATEPPMPDPRSLPGETGAFEEDPILPPGHTPAEPAGLQRTGT